MAGGKSVLPRAKSVGGMVIGGWRSEYEVRSLSISKVKAK